jgi:membrane protein DedA with SNARE-associated domain
VTVTPLIASLTQPLIDFATGVVDSIGAWGVFVLMTLESACIPSPSEATMLFAGKSSAEPNASFTFFAAVTAGVLGNVVGSWITWWIGRIGRVDLLEKHGARFGVRKHHLEIADRWFEQHGEATVFFSRMLPIVRTFISLPAGVARMPFWKFTIYTFLGCIPWVLFLTWAGVKAGEHWEDVKHYLEYVDYLVAAGIIGVVVWLVIRSRRGTDSEPGSDAASS